MGGAHSFVADRPNGATGQAVDERTLRMNPELPPSPPVAVVDLLLLLVLAEVPRRNEPGACEIVRVVAGLLDLVEVLLGEEAAVGEQRLVDRAQLVDAELGVGNAPASSAPPSGRTAQRHQPDDLLEHPVPELHPVEKRHGVVPEEAAVEGPNRKAMSPGAAPREEVSAPAVETLADQPEQGLDAVVQVVAVQGLLARQAHHLEVAQPFEAVALPVRLRVDRRVAEVGPRFDVEEEEQPVHVAETLQAEFARERIVEPVDAVLGHLAEVPDRLVADELDGFAKRVLEVLGDREGVLVAVLVQVVEQARALVRKQAFAVKQGGSGLQGVVLAAAEDVV